MHPLLLWATLLALSSLQSWGNTQQYDFQNYSNKQLEEIILELKAPHQATACKSTPYAVIEYLKRLSNQGEKEKAIRLGQHCIRFCPNLDLALTLAQYQADANQTKAAARTLAFTQLFPYIPSANQENILKAAEILTTIGKIDWALNLYEALLDFSEPSEEFRRSILPQAIATARKANETSLEFYWKKDLQELETHQKN